MASAPPRPSYAKIDPSHLVLNERVVFTRRIAKVVKGGRHLRFNALVIVGDGEGVVGAGLGKALAIPDAVRKGNALAKKGLIRIPLKGSTIPQETSSKKSAALVLIKPAPPGTGIIAAGVIRAMLDLAGVKDVVAKSLGSRNPINVVYATLDALQKLKDPAEEMARRRSAVRPERPTRISGPDASPGRERGPG
jgi:small subunit ribosomal protein S5